MDKEQEEIQFLSFFGILKESFSIVSKWRKIFTQITLFLILPLSFIYLLHIQVTDILFTKIQHDKGMLASELITFVLFKIGYFIFFIVFTLLSIAAVVYTIACIYTAQELSFRKVMSVMPKVWKRLMVTFICNFLTPLVYINLPVLVVNSGLFLLGQIKVWEILFSVASSVAYFNGFIYITIIGDLASVFLVLKDSYGLNAMTKSQNLIKVNVGVVAAVVLVFVIIFSLLGIELMFRFLVVYGHGQGIGSSIVLGIVCLVLLSVAMLFALVSQSIVYFICASYIDKSSLSDHLGEYVPLKYEDVQSEQYEV